MVEVEPGIPLQRERELGAIYEDSVALFEKSEGIREREGLGRITGETGQVFWTCILESILDKLIFERAEKSSEVSKQPRHTTPAPSASSPTIERVYGVGKPSPPLQGLYRTTEVEGFAKTPDFSRPFAEIPCIS